MPLTDVQVSQSSGSLFGVVPPLTSRNLQHLSLHLGTLSDRHFEKCAFGCGLLLNRFHSTIWSFKYPLRRLLIGPTNEPNQRPSCGALRPTQTTAALKLASRIFVGIRAGAPTVVVMKLFYIRKSRYNSGKKGQRLPMIRWQSIYPMIDASAHVGSLGWRHFRGWLLQLVVLYARGTPCLAKARIG